jgi:hypothetical protein
VAVVTVVVVTVVVPVSRVAGTLMIIRITLSRLDGCYVMDTVDPTDLCTMRYFF